MSEEEAKTVDPESRRLEIVENAAGEVQQEQLSPEEQKALVAEKMKELEAAGVKIPDMQMAMSPPGMPMGMSGMGPGMGMGMHPGMTSIGAPSMVATPPPPMQHMPDPMHMPPDDRQQQNHPAIKRARRPDPDIRLMDDGLIQLDPMMMMEIELLTAEQRAAAAEEQLASRALRDARERLMSLHRKQSMLMSSITSKLGLPPGGSIRLVDKEQRLCRIEE